ncbi:starch synthase [Anaerobacterium chartisolvens]|uniref:Glycogen synthase n=1 Tax=Anaerobacterium chartisolvens TaxID=1297424 RepID=A0A369AWC7_9FIRM|nr:glycogen synthase GlgA [Anaerobacterium chartisolvens]RCX13471.1 starch synthase [Anaerobacterium chartisolvens]
MENMRVLLASSEAVPFAKTGGLADVAGSLPPALKKLGQDIRLIIPKYKCIASEYTGKMEKLGEIMVNVGWRRQYCGVFKLVHNEVTVYFIDNEYYFKRDGLYGYFDQAEQFVFFCKAIIEVLPMIGFKPDVIHCNDWQTAIIPLLLKDHYKRFPFYASIKTLFTIHNLSYQGVFPEQVLPDLTGISWEYFNQWGVEFYGGVNFMKAGLAFADMLSTVSTTYVQEIKGDFFGENLNGVLNSRASSLYGILNGIDTIENDPATDGRLFANYDVNNLEGKYINKRMLQQSLGLEEDPEMPVISVISRLVDQKGFDLIACVLNDMLQMDIQIVVLGTGEYKYEEMFKNTSAAFPRKVSANIRYDSTLAQRIYAGSDMFLMPSLFEPCGLGQLFSMRYGTVPIVRETGGLNDTVKAYQESTGEGNGFTFANYNAHDMLYTIRRAVSFYHNKQVWNKLITKCMSQDYSWDKSASQYVELYEKLQS